MRIKASYLFFIFSLSLPLGLLASTSIVYADQAGQSTSETRICKALGLEECVESVNNNPAPIVIDGEEFTAEDDSLELHTITGTRENDPTNYENRDWWPYHNAYYRWGTSWVRNQEIGYLSYRGTTQAGGNVYKGKRIVQTSLKYKRGGTVLGTAKSTAVHKSGRWKAGSVSAVWANDSLNSKAPQTQFTYNYYTVNP